MAEPRLAERLVCWAGRLWPLTRGTDRLMRSRLARLVPTEGERIITLRGGVRIPVSLADHNGRELAVFGAAELATIAVCRKLLRPGDTFLDIGANHGGVGFACLGAIGPTGLLVLVEPNPELHQRLVVAELPTGAAPVWRFPSALSDSEGTATLDVPAGWSGRGTLTAARNDDHRRATVTVRVRRTKDFLAGLRGARIGAKVDVEGHEEHVVPALLQDSRTRFVVFERGIMDRDERLLAIARRLGFREQRHTSGDVLVVRG